MSHLALLHAAACACRPASWSGRFASPPLQTGAAGAGPGFPRSAAPGGLEAIAILKQASPRVSPPPCACSQRDCCRLPPPWQPAFAIIASYGAVRPPASHRQGTHAILAACCSSWPCRRRALAPRQRIDQAFTPRWFVRHPTPPLGARVAHVLVPLALALLSERVGRAFGGASGGYFNFS